MSFKRCVTSLRPLGVGFAPALTLLLLFSLLPNSVFAQNEKIVSDSLAVNERLLPSVPWTDFYGEAYTDDDSATRRLRGILSTLLLAHTTRNLKTVLDTEGQRLRLFFISGKRIIKDNRITSAALSRLSKETQELYVGEEINGHTCWIRVLPSQEHHLVIALHDANIGNDDDLMQCFVVALWLERHGNLDGFDVENWRQAIADLATKTQF